jgi:Flp pilus assembly protein TadG
MEAGKMRRGFGGAGRQLARFIEDRSGNFAVITAAILTTILLSVGFGINTAQMVLTRSNLLNALDSAVTSTARDLTTGAIPEDDAEKTVKAFLFTNGGTGFASADKISLDSLVVDHTAKTVTATASVNISLLFPLFGAADSQKISVTSAALYSDKQVEVAMMLDLTGSMAKTKYTDKIGDLRLAATNAVKTMLGNQNTNNPRVRVALVPYASGVNVGALVNNVYAETSSSSDLPPVAGSKLLVSKTGSKALPLFATYKSIVASAYPHSDNCATERKDRYGNADFSADGPDTIRTDKNGQPYYALVNRDNHLSGSSMNKCPDAKVIPLTTDEDALLDSIDDFEANGYTAGAIAVQWTYYMLSSQWRSAIKDAGLGDGPANTNPDKLSKVAILMTDGQFNTAYAGVSNDYNDQGDVARGNAESICSNMKADGIEVYTIGFDLDDKSMSATERAEAKSVLKNCSSPDKPGRQHFFDASTGTELDGAFQKIIADIEGLVLTQ